MKQFNKCWTDFVKVDTAEFYEKLPSHFKFYLDQTCLMMTLHEDLHDFLLVSS
jgi:hypothetical protein